jgi:hypothetical protein
VAAHADDAVVAVGSKYVSSNYKPLIERWEQTSPGSPPCFKAKSSPSVSDNGELYGVARIPTSSVTERPFWAVGYQGSTSRVWDSEIADWVVGGDAETLIEYSSDGGQTWSIVSSPNVEGEPSVLKSVYALSTTNAWAVGYYGDVNSTRTLILHWDGTSWSIVSSPNQTGADDNYLHSVSMVSEDFGWAVGTTTHPTTYYRDKNLILFWNGTSWAEESSTPQPSQFWNYLFAVVGISSSQAHAIGSYLPDVGNKDTQALVWDNINGWAYESSPSPGSGANVFYGIAPVSSSYIWGVGSAEDPPHKTLTSRRVNGTWYHVSSPNANSYSNELRAVTVVPGTSVCAGGNNWAVGFYFGGSSSNSNRYTLAMRYHMSATCDLDP